MSTLVLQFLGPLTVKYDGRRLSHFRTRSVQALLAYLAVESGRPLRRDALAELLWPGYPPGSARKNLRQTLYELRQMIPAVATATGAPDLFVLADRQTVQINPNCVYEVDTQAFSRLLAAGDDRSLEKAVELYHGEFLEDLFLPDNGDFDEWAAARRAHFRRGALEALARLAERALARGAPAEAAGYARRQVAIDDLQETPVRQLMQALAAQGKRSEALLVYEAVREQLQEELDVVPSAETTELWRRIRDGETSEVEMPAAEPPAAPVAAAAMAVHNLPAQATAFIGREEELDEICRLLVEDPACRLLTILGPGGSGKTRLALQAAATLAEEGKDLFADGIWFIPLAPVQEARELAFALAHVLDFSFIEAATVEEQMLDHLRERRLLLLLDNFEQLVGEESGAFMASLLRRAPGVKALVTSRARLQVAGEQIFPVLGLETPPPKTELLDELRTYEGVRLFFEAARRARPAFALTNDNGPEVAHLCRLLGGIPLAIELAASWVELLEPAEIVAEVTRSLDFLEAKWHGLPARQRSLRAVFEASWQLLDSREQEILRGMSYFAGSISREAAEAVAGARLPHLLSLVNKSWLTRGDDGRYHLHPLLCQYAAERLWAEPAAGRQIEEAHHQHYAALGAQLAQRVRGPGQADALATFAAEYTNFRGAWKGLLRAGRLEQLVTDLLPIFFSHAESRLRGLDIIPLLDAALSETSSDDAAARRVRATLLTAYGAFMITGYPVRAEYMGLVLPAYRTHIEEAWSLAGGEMALRFRGAGFWGILLAYLYGRLVDLEAGLVAAWSHVAAMREEKHAWELALALHYLVLLLTLDLADEAEADESLALARESLALFESVGDKLESGHALHILGQIAWLRRRPAEAIPYWQDAQERLAEAGNETLAAIIDWEIGDAWLTLGQVEEAFDHYHLMEERFAEAGQRRFLGYMLSKRSLEASRYCPLEEAWPPRRRSLALSQELDDRFGEAWNIWEMGELYRLDGDTVNARLWYERAKPLFEEVGDENGRAFYHRGLGDLALMAADYHEAAEQFRASLALVEGKHSWMETYAGRGLVLAQQGLGEWEAAWERWRAVLALAEREGHLGLLLAVLAAGVAVYAGSDQRERAVELASFVVQHPLSWNETRAQAEEMLREIELQLSPAIVALARERGAGLALEAVVERELSGQE